jgi:hypothetical protein
VLLRLKNRTGKTKGVKIQDQIKRKPRRREDKHPKDEISRRLRTFWQ